MIAPADEMLEAALQAWDADPCSGQRDPDLIRQCIAAALAAALNTLPATDEQYRAWMREHGLGHGAGIATVISAVRADLRRLAGGPT
jgi:hypothetical protein